MKMIRMLCFLFSYLLLPMKICYGESRLENVLKEVNGIIYIITMKEREQHAIDTINALGLHLYSNHVEMISAISYKDYKEFTPNVIDNMIQNGTIVSFPKKNNDGIFERKIPPHLKITPGKIASWRSHIKAHRRFLSSKFKVALFLEDDLLLNDMALIENHLKLEIILKKRLSNSKLIFLGYCNERCHTGARFYTMDHNITKSSTSMNEYNELILNLEKKKYIKTSKLKSSSFNNNNNNNNEQRITYRDAIAPYCNHAYLSTKKGSFELLKHISKLYTGKVDSMFSSILLEAFHIRIINSDEDRFKKFNIYNNYEKRNNRNTKEFNLVLDEKLKEASGKPDQYWDNNDKKYFVNDDDIKSDKDRNERLFNDDIKSGNQLNWVHLRSYVLIPPLFNQDSEMKSLSQLGGDSIPTKYLIYNSKSTSTLSKKDPFIDIGKNHQKLTFPFCKTTDCDCETKTTGDFLDYGAMGKAVNTLKIHAEV